MSEAENRVIACDICAIKPEEREQHELTTKQLFASVLEVRELAEGYAFRLPNENSILQRAAQFIANERLCCPFFDFTLKAQSQGQLWLWLTGSDEVKQFIPVEFGSMVSATPADAFAAP